MGVSQNHPHSFPDQDAQKPSIIHVYIHIHTYLKCLVALLVEKVPLSQNGLHLCAACFLC